MMIKNESHKAILLGVLLLSTLATLGIQSLHINKVLTLDHLSPYFYEAVDDRSNNGKSQSYIEVVDNKLVLHCDIIASDYQWPFCELSFNFLKGINTKAGNTQGIDLSGYTHARVWAKYDSPQVIGIRFQTRNFDPSYSHLGDDGSLKYNGIEFYEKNISYPVLIPLANFQIPTWWLVAKEIPIPKMGPEFNNTHTVDIATGNGIKPGKYTLIIERVEFVGQYISDQNVYLFLLLVWAISALLYFFGTLRNIRKKLKESNHRQQELEALNNLLNIRSQTLEEKISRDPLTGLLNRNGLANIFNSENKARNTSNLSIIFIDIDHFKKINDTYGHNDGDKVLVQLSGLLSKNTRDIDVIARWGGEEFILACPNTELKQAARLAEKLRSCIELDEWPHNLKVTASFGVAEMRNESPTDFIGRADKALYDAKAQGRNCVVVSPEPS